MTNKPHFFLRQTQKQWPFLILVVLCAILIYPSAHEIIGHPLGDMSSHFWGGWWFGSELLSGNIPLWATESHMPQGGRFYYIDPIGGFLMLLLRPFGPIIAWNGMIFIQLGLSALGGYLVGFSIHQQKTHGVFLGVLLISSSYSLGSLHSGASEYFGLGIPCLLIWSLRDSLQTKNWKRTCLFIGLCTTQAFYYGAFGCLLVFCLCLFQKDRWKLGLKILIGGIICSLPVLLLGWWSLSQGSATSNQVLGNQVLPIIEFNQWLPFSQNSAEATNPGIQIKHSFRYTTLILIFVGLMYAVQARKWSKEILLFSILALGPTFVWKAQGKDLSESLMYLPAALLYLPELSPFKWIHHPYRVAAFVIPLWGIIAVKALPLFHPKSLWLVIPIVFFEGLHLSGWPIASTPTPKPAIVDTQGYRLNWPPNQAGGRNQYLREQVFHQQTIATGVNILISPDLRKDSLIQKLEAIYDKSKKISPSNSHLYQLGFHTLVLHKRFMPPKARLKARKMIEKEFGKEIAESKDWVVYQIHTR